MFVPSAPLKAGAGSALRSPCNLSGLLLLSQIAFIASGTGPPSFIANGGELPLLPKAHLDRFARKTLEPVNRFVEVPDRGADPQSFPEDFPRPLSQEASLAFSSPSNHPVSLRNRRWVAINLLPI